MPRKVKSKEEDGDVLKCNKCAYTTTRKAFMQDHVRIHTGERPFKCETCGKSFTQKSNLTKHQIVHGAGYKTEFKCDRCDFSTMYKQSLKMHLNWHDGVKPYKCNLCDRTFSQSTHRRTHMKEAHGNERKFQCHLCSKCFKRKEHLDKHLVFHTDERKYECDICQKKFYEQKHVAIHMLVHTGEETKVHKCDLCEYKSRYKQGLQVHYRIHLGVRPYKCEDCDKAFRTSQTLRIHSRMVHQGMMGKIFSCDMCEYNTANKQTLKLHIDHIHMGVKHKRSRIKCEYCSRIYATKSSLHGHKRKKHPIKLRRELQEKIKQRLASIKRVPGVKKDNNSLTNSIDDYRYRITLQNARNTATKLAKNRKITVKSSGSPTKLISPKKEVITPRKSPRSAHKVKPNSPSSGSGKKIRLADLLNKSPGEKIITRRNLAKELNIAEPPSVTQEKEVPENKVDVAQTKEVTKVSYMSNLGLQHASNDEEEKNGEELAEEAQRKPSSEKDISKESRAKAAKETDENANQEKATATNKRKRVAKNKKEKPAKVAKIKETKSNQSKQRQPKQAKVSRGKKAKNTITKISNSTENDSQLSKVISAAANTDKSQEKSSTTSDQSSSTTISKPKSNRGKNLNQIVNSLAAAKKATPSLPKPVVEYEPAPEPPCLGPWEPLCEPLDLSIQTLGSVTSRVPGEYHQQVPMKIESSPLKSYDSLRDLASVYMSK